MYALRRRHRDAWWHRCAVAQLQRTSTEVATTPELPTRMLLGQDIEGRATKSSSVQASHVSCAWVPAKDLEPRVRAWPVPQTDTDRRPPTQHGTMA